MTETGTNFNADASGAELWLSISELAEVKGKTRQTIHERVEKLESEGLLTTKPGPNRTRLVNLVEFDRAVGETTDFSHQQAAATRARQATADEQEAPAGTGFTEAQRMKMRYEAALKQIEFGERTKQLVAVADIKAVVEKIAGACRGAVDVLLLRTDEITAAAAKDGAAGVRAVLKDASYKLLATMSQAFRTLETISKESDASGTEIDLKMPDEDAP
jgi:DNA-binding Lrp family transcriptional regulator